MPALVSLQQLVRPSELMVKTCILGLGCARRLSVRFSSVDSPALWTFLRADMANVPLGLCFQFELDSPVHRNSGQILVPDHGVLPIPTSGADPHTLRMEFYTKCVT